MELVNGGSEYAYYSQAREIYLYPQFVEVGAPSVEQIALLLNGMVGVKFYCDFSSVKQDILDNGYVILTGSRYERNIPISSADKVTEDGKTYYTFTYEVAAKEMDLNIKLSIYDGSGQALSIKNGNAAGNTAFAYSVYDYLKSAEDITDTNHLALRIPLERNSLHASAGRLSAPNGKFLSYTGLRMFLPFSSRRNAL